MNKKFFWICLALALSWGILQYWPVTVRIHGTIPEEDFCIAMPLKDKRQLEYFFRDVCFLNAWAYTLIGSKPMSVHQYRKPWESVKYFLCHPELKYILYDCFWPPNFREICLLFNPQQLKIKWGWDTLNKYMSKLPNSRFVLYTRESPDNEIVILTLVDKKKMLDTVMNYLEDFQMVLQNQKVKPEELIDAEKLHRFLIAISSNGLFGTVLGFGRNNSRLFEKYQEMNLGKFPMTSPWKDEDDAHLKHLNEKDLSFEPWDISDLFYPLFACDPDSEETKQLQQTYREEREKIINYYKDRDVVEATLSLLNQKL